MAGFPSLEFFSEIEELAHFVDGKGDENNFNILNDDDLDMSSDIPSHGLFRWDDCMLAVDSSNNLLLGDPLLNRPMLCDQSELLNLQPASTGFNPETLIPVSLPADSSTHTVEPPAEPEKDVLPERDSEVQEPQEKQSVQSTNVSLIATPTCDVSPAPDVNSAPVRIVVNTRFKSRPRNIKMVAPALLPKPTHNLVKIPKAEESTTLTRLKRIRSGEKLVRHPNQPDIGSSEQKSPRSSTIKKCRHEQSEVVASSPARSTSPSSDVSDREGIPFWSLRSRHSSVSSGMKRKAYELDPLRDPQMERCRRNAVNAKKNRELRKAHMAELEQKVEDVCRERDELAGENESLKEAKLKLEQEVKHLNNILKNQSQLSSLIGKLAPSSVILGDLSASGNEEDQIISSGMCLHVDGQNATIEYCSYCAKKAGKKLSE